MRVTHCRSPFRPASRIPELIEAQLTLVLDMETIALIYLNNISMWNDERIKKINSPEVAALLPAKPIMVVTVVIGNALNQLITEVLSAAVDEFKQRVRAASLARFLERWFLVPATRAAALIVVRLCPMPPRRRLARVLLFRCPSSRIPHDRCRCTTSLASRQ